MPNINWEMMTQFIFPEALGIAEEVVSVEVIPRWKQVETEESIRLTGIYHIKATVKFNPNVKRAYSEGTYIEHLDLKGDEGYFEYAMPLEVDLPREKVASGDTPELAVQDISFFVYDGSSCTFKWEVKCKFEEPIEGALFQIESEKELVKQGVAVASRGEISEETGEMSSPSTLEHKLVNEVLQQATIESSTHEKKVTEQGAKEEKIIEGLQHPSFESIAEELTSESIESINFVEEAKKIRKETEEDKKVMNSIVEQKEKWNMPSDADDFYNELSESYTLLKFR
ncbi:MAG: hypothetical protein GX072_03490 [Lysinibacillus sp.]|nr:hypothetical protein [Lysinibacillus sp.]